MGTGKRKSARRAVKVPGLLASLDWLDAHHPRHAHGKLWDSIGRHLRRRPGALLDRIAELVRDYPASHGDLYGEIDDAHRILTDEITRRGGGE